MMPVHAYLFEAKSVQGFILSTNRLKELVGGSELIESICNELLDQTLQGVGVKPRFSRRAGGAFSAFSEDRDALLKLARVWTLILSRYAPGLPFQSGMGEGENDIEAFHNAKRAADAARSFRPDRLPTFGPLAERDRRTGEAAVARKSIKGDMASLCETTYRKLDKAFSGRKLAQRFLGRDIQGYRWPTLLSPDEDSPSAQDQVFPFLPQQENLALIHADGNGLGQMLIDLSHALEGDAAFVDVFRDFSDALSAATEAAAQSATHQVLLPHAEDGLLPARPIVLGGDDITLLVRADLALGFTQAFLQAFEEETNRRLPNVWRRLPAAQPKPADELTACAGIAYIKPNYPFHLAHRLAEGLCRQAKQASKAIRRGNHIPSSLAFHRVTSTLIEGMQDAQREMSVDTAGATYHFGLPAYGVKLKDGGLPWIGHLDQLVGDLQDPEFSRAPRQILSLIGRDIAEARRRYKRWQEVSGRQAARIIEHIEALQSGPLADDLPFVKRPGAQASFETALGDALALAAVGHAPAKEP